MHNIGLEMKDMRKLGDIIEHSQAGSALHKEEPLVQHGPEEKAYQKHLKEHIHKLLEQADKRKLRLVYAFTKNLID